MADQLEGAAAPSETSLRDSLTDAFNAGGSEPPVEETPAEPVSEPEAASDEGVPRTPDGRFATKGAEATAAEGEPAVHAPADPGPTDGTTTPEGEKPPEEATAPAEQADAAPVPPPGWSPTAKDEFEQLPESVRAAVAKREVEVEQGFVKLRDYKTLDPYIEMARQGGTTLDKAVENYVRAEQRLETNPVEAIQWLMNSYGVTPAQIVGATQQPQPQQASGQQQPAPQPQVDFSPIINQVNELRDMVVGERQAKVGAEIDTFFSDSEKYPYAENVADQMAELIKKGVAEDLPDAYAKACAWDTEISGLLIKKQADDTAASKAAEAKRKVDQASLAGGSITGDASETELGEPPETDLRASLEKQFYGDRA